MKAVYDLVHAPQDYCRAWGLGLGLRYHFRSTLTLDVAVFGCTYMTAVMNHTGIQTCTGEGMNMFSFSCFKCCLSTRAMDLRGFRSCC